MPVINMRSSANLVKGQGVGSCYEEQLRMVSEGLGTGYVVNINSNKQSDITHYHTVNFGYYLERLFKRGKNSGIGYVHFLPDTLDNSLDLPFLFRKIFDRYLLSFYNSMDYLVTVNPGVIKKLENYKITKPKILYIPNFVSQESFYPQNEKKAMLNREMFELPTDRFIVMGAGQLQKRKGVLDFVEVARRMPHVQFIWAGGFSFGKLSDGYDEIKALMQNPPDNLRFLGIIDRDKMVDLYNAADMLFLPSYDELFPMTILEAMCCKKPLLLRDIDVYTDILFDCYMKAGDVEGFMACIEKISVDKNEQEYWKEKSWSCHMYYSEENILKMWEALYAEAYLKARNENIPATEGI